MATVTEYLSFDAIVSPSHPQISLNIPGAWNCVDYSALYDSAPAIGEDRVIPGSPGRLYVAREDDELPVSLPIEVQGDVNASGTPYASAVNGVRLNLRYLRTHLLLPRLLRAVTFHYFDGTTATGSVVVVPPAQVAMDSPTSARIVLHLVVPASALT